MGEVTWDKMFAEGSFDLPTTNFMERVKQAITKEDFQHIKKEFLKAIKDEKDDFCKSNYSTLTDAKNKLYSMVTEILVQEVGCVLDHDIRMINYERSEIKKQMSQIEYNTNRANAKKTTRDTLVEEFEIAKKELFESVLTKETSDKLRILTTIADTIDKAWEEENQVREHLNHIILKSEKVHGPLAERLVTLEDQYQLLAELE